MEKQGQRSNRGRGNNNGGGKSKGKREAERLDEKAIIRFKIPQPNETTLSCKFEDSESQEVKEYINAYVEGDSHTNLVTLMEKIMSLGDRYEMFNTKSKQLSQYFA